MNHLRRLGSKLVTSEQDEGQLIKYLQRNASDVKSAENERANSILSAQVVERFIKLLKDLNAKDVKGIFRISGNATQVKRLIAQVSEGNEVIVLEDSAEVGKTVHLVATAFKGYLASADVSIVPAELYNDFIHIIDEGDSESNLEKYSTLLQNVPPSHYKIMDITISFLIEIQENFKENLISLDNCGILFGPLFFRPLVFDSSYILNVGRQSKTVEYLIQNHVALFKNEIIAHPIYRKSPMVRRRSSNEVRFLEADAILSQSEIDELSRDQDISSEQTITPHEWKSVKKSGKYYCSICLIKIRKKEEVSVCGICNQIAHGQCATNNMNTCFGEIIETNGSVLTVGQEVPNIFVKNDSEGNRVTLHDILNEGKKVILFYYAKSFSPVCTLQNKCFRNNYDIFHYANCDVIGVSPDSPTVQKAFAKLHNLPFTLLSDQDAHIRNTFRIPSLMGGMVPSRTTFIINPYTRTIVKVYSSTLAVFEHVYASITALSELMQLEASGNVLSQEEDKEAANIVSE